MQPLQLAPFWQFVVWARQLLLLLDAFVPRWYLPFAIDEQELTDADYRNVVLAHTGGALAIFAFFWWVHARVRPYAYVFQVIMPLPRLSSHLSSLLSSPLSSPLLSPLPSSLLSPLLASLLTSLLSSHLSPHLSSRLSSPLSHLLSQNQLESWLFFCNALTVLLGCAYTFVTERRALLECASTPPVPFQVVMPPPSL